MINKIPKDGLYRICRSFSYSSYSRNLFGGTKEVAFNKPLSAPSGKSETSTNPADLIKRNDILMFSDKPINYIESVKSNGFHLANDLLITSPDENNNIIGTILLDSETFEVNLSNNGFKFVNGFMVEFEENEILQIFSRVHPKPEILVVGLGKKPRVLVESNRKFFSKLGIQLEVSDSNNAAQNFDVLATERPHVIGALLLPPNI